MTIESFGKNLRFEKPATYRIRVNGHIDDSLSDQLGMFACNRCRFEPLHQVHSPLLAAGIASGLKTDCLTLFLSRYDNWQF